MRKGFTVERSVKMRIPIIGGGDPYPTVEIGTIGLQGNDWKKDDKLKVTIFVERIKDDAGTDGEMGPTDAPGRI